MNKTDSEYMRKDIICTIFNYLYYKTYNNPNYRVNLNSQSQGKVIDNFLLNLDKRYGRGSIGYNFLIDYFCFQWDYWLDKDLNRNISLSWVIGKKALDRFYNRNENYQYFYRQNLIEKINVNPNKIVDLLKLDYEDEEKEEYIDFERKRFSDHRRLSNCMLNSIKFSSRSLVCLNCEFKKECEDIPVK